jgi:Helix-turn-helix domain/DnaA N-terminal domain
MLPKKLDTTLALKAICLTDKLNGTEKRIGIALLDHFNRTTGRCDPSYETLAELLGINRRTVGRGVTKLVKIRFFSMVRHGGIGNTNSYQPSWALYRDLEERWKRHRQQHATRFLGQEMSPLPGQLCPTSGGEAVLQTYSTNFIPLTSSQTKQTKAPAENQAGAFSRSGTPEGTGGLGIFDARIEKRLGKEVHHAWFRNVHFVDVTDGIIILSAQNEQIKSRIEQWYGPDILKCFEPEYKNSVRVDVVVHKPSS